MKISFALVLLLSLVALPAALAQNTGLFLNPYSAPPTTTSPSVSKSPSPATGSPPNPSHAIYLSGTSGSNQPTAAPTKKPRLSPSSSPTKKPVVLTYSPTKKPTEAPSASQESSVAVTSESSTSKPTIAVAKNVTVPGTMLVSTASNFTFNSTTIMQWEATTSAYYTSYYQQTSGLKECSVTAYYESVEQYQYQYNYMISFRLEVNYQYTSVSKVVQVAQQVISNSTSKQSYSKELEATLQADIAVKTVEYSTSKPTKKPTKKPTTAPTNVTTFSDVGSAVCFAQFSNETDELAFAVYFKDSKDVTTKSTVGSISQAMQKSILDLLKQNATALASFQLTHFLGVSVDNVTLDDTPALYYSPTYSLEFKTLSFNMTLSFECCADYEKLEMEVFKLVKLLLLSEQETLAKNFKQNLNDEDFQNIKFASGVSLTQDVMPTVSPTGSPTMTSTTAQTDMPTFSPTSKQPLSVNVPGKMMVSTSSYFSFTSTTITQWESFTSAYYTNYYQQTSGLQECSVTAQYQSSERVQSFEQYTVSFSLVVTYTKVVTTTAQTSVSVAEYARKALSSSTAKQSYSAKLKANTGVNLTVTDVEYVNPPTSSPTKSPSKKPRSSPSSSPSKKPVVFTYSPTTTPAEAPSASQQSSATVASLMGTMVIQCSSALNAKNYVTWQNETASYIVSYWSTYDGSTKLTGLKNVTIIPGQIANTETKFEYVITYSLLFTFDSSSVSVTDIAQYPFANTDVYKYMDRLSKAGFSMSFVDLSYSDASLLNNADGTSLPAATSQSNSATSFSSAAVRSSYALSHTICMIGGALLLFYV